ncbi:MAG: tRNA (adenosine(37)-N6)-dimethylallyltransferase MiaA [Candidatus Lloydbacteria bacterium CG22_combo_CG10-13_8_21_14_all_47_15]|uniref:tRNA dimethylallyltransferase n=1 Tax=Candidatus Lloydbacteria bacterium CG22_combo_CG10-13_8_21_14_all_47_15 TaxID=1974635 RepID=A0A2H0CWD1_9BACT|nr:MAG: tRNA (adenosine(37)-N6)-dimethylallyltransferase MiaA [Candidatus Lloydbacteria bacterium CG22_combo_CG10-13_8_21_14_all_47_15]
MSLSIKKNIRKSSVGPKILVVVGPTASGKSNLAVSLAKTFNGEVVSADSRQVYRGLDIGTGKVTARETAGIPHHLLNVASPRRAYDAAKYQKKASDAITDIVSRGKLPIIAGGSGFWVNSLVDSIAFPDVTPDIALRKNLSKKSTDELFRILKQLDPRRAKTIDRKNSRRLIRAIEITKTIGIVPPLKKTKPSYKPLFIGIALPLETLKTRIATRTNAMLRRGLIAEVRHLRESGISAARLRELGFEYALPAEYLNGTLTRDELEERLNTETYRYAKRQMTWFRRDSRIIWISGAHTAFRETRKFLAPLQSP